MMTTVLLAVHLCAAQLPANYAAPNLLVEAGDPKLKDYRILDARTKKEYEAGHVPGAVHADTARWSKALQDGNAAGVFMLDFGRLGLSPKIPVVVYADDARDAARAWWLLKYAGVPDARILNGGWKAWTSAKLKTENFAPPVPAHIRAWKIDASRLADKEHVLGILKGGAACVDARSEEEFTGEKALAKRGGRVPGATHLEWVELLDPETGKYIPPPKLAKLIADRKIDLARPQVTYCQGGGRAAVVAFGLELAGAKDVRNYYRSWGEWGNDPDTPVEKK